jgi:hypothetical protein
MHGDRRPAFLRVSGSCVIYEQAPHQPRRHRKEVDAVLPLHPLLVHQLEVRLVYQRGGREGVAAALAPQVRARDLAQLRIDRVDQAGFGTLLPVAPREGDVTSGRHHPSLYSRRHLRS